VSCSNLKKLNTFGPLDLITTYRIALGYTYNFNATLSNKNTKYLKSITDSFSLTVNNPEANNGPLSCLDFRLTFKNQTYPVNNISSNEV
jgi:hypothetical protein